jgi:ATP-binding cassette subfamily B protein
MRSLGHLNKYFYKYRVRLLLGILFVGTSNYFGVRSLTVAGHTVDIIRDYVALSQKTPTSTEIFYQELMVQFLVIIAWAIVSGVFLFLTRQTIIVLSRLIEYDMKNEIFAHYQRLDVAFYKRNNTGDLMNRISEDVGKVRMYTGPTVMYVISTFFSFLFTIIEMRNTDATLTLYTLLPLPVLAVSIYYISDKIYRKSTSVQEKLSDITTFSQEAFSGIRILKAYGREKHSIHEFEKQSNEYRQRTMKLVRTESLFQPFVVGLIGLSVILTIYVGSQQYFAGEISIGSIATFILFINRLTWPIASLGWVTSLVQRAAASQARINEFLQTSPNISNPGSAELVIDGEIEFRNVSFVYPDSGIKALDNVSFKINKGGSLAIIGRTGSGKSTIAHLICRLYDADSGEILVDGRNIKEHNLEALRAQTGYVPQEVFLFSDTIGNNIAFALNQEQKQQSLVEKAAKDAAIYSNIIEFPAKFETVVGERGITLSGGQKQRISIARAIIAQPRILIFDDCLSAVDTETEEIILQNLKGIMKGRTSVIISHRVSSVKSADRIVVMDQGRIIETGSHQELLDRKGEYFDLYKMQLLEEEKPLP